MAQTYKRFGELLVSKGTITQEQLDEALNKQQTTMSHRKIGEVLVRINAISKSHISETLAEQLGVAVVDLSQREIPERIRGMIDGGIATLYRVIPVDERGKTLIIATNDPTNINSLDNLSRLLDRPVEPVIASADDIGMALRKYYNLQENTVESMLDSASSVSSMSSLSSMSNMASLDSSVGGSSMSASEISMDSIGIDDIDTGSSGGGIEGIDDEDDNSPVMRYVHQMILEAFRLRASDIHVEPGKTDVKVRYRVDGIMHMTPTPPKRAQPSIISRIKLMSGMNISERRLPQDGRIKMNMGGKMIDLRVSALPAAYGESVVMRILDKGGLMLGLGQLGFSAEVQTHWERMLTNATGVILVTGPTGSGKTTTLYASLHNLNRPERKLVTVEDPVEYQLSGINQVQINHDIGWNFSRALRAIFRQDPDIVMVGEIRDEETAEIAIKAALTGHLVFSTLHTNDTASSFIRLIDIGVKPFLVASGVRAILAQRLVRVTCSNCKEPYTPDPVQLERLGFPVNLDEVTVYHGAGCPMCNENGYQGRLGVYELLETNDHIRGLLMEGETSTELRRAARLNGMTTMREDAWQKVLQGVTTVEEVNRATRVDEPLKHEKVHASIHAAHAV